MSLEFPPYSTDPADLLVPHQLLPHSPPLLDRTWLLRLYSGLLRGSLKYFIDSLGTAQEGDEERHGALFEKLHEALQREASLECEALDCALVRQYE